MADIITYDNLQEVKIVKVANGYDVKVTYKTKEVAVKAYKPNHAII